MRLVIVTTIFIFTLFHMTHGPGVSQSEYSTSDRVKRLFPELNPDENTKCGLPYITVERGRGVHVDASRPSLQKSRILGPFRVHYDSVGANTPALLNGAGQRIPGSHEGYIDSVLTIAGNVLAELTTLYGYSSAPSDGVDGGGPEYDIYIEELSNLYGFTMPERQIDTKPDGGRFVTYLEIDNDFIFVSPFSNKGLPALRVTLAHEYHHAIQLGNYGYWGQDRYYYEITSTWMEDLLFTEVNDYLQYLPAHFANPSIAFAAANGSVEYARCLWGHYVAKRFGPDAIRLSWENIRDVPTLRAIDNALRSAPYFATFRTAMAEWSEWNYHTGIRSDSIRYYPEGSVYPLVAQTVVDISSGGRDITGSLPPLASRYFQLRTATEAIGIMLTNINFDHAVQSGSTTSFPYTYQFRLTDPGAGFKPAGTSAFVRLDVPDISNWYAGGLTSPVENGVPFPSPFITDGRGVVSIPIAAGQSLNASLSIFSIDMDRIFSFSGLSRFVAPPGSQVVQWDGTKNSGEAASSGVYVYYLEYDGKVLHGKIVLIRK